jgi:anti-sigma-K factor RskA
MKIDIDKLTEAELVDLNNRIVERLRFLTHMRAHAQMERSVDNISALWRWPPRRGARAT